MEYRQIYENLLKTLCNAYRKMFQLLEGVDHCDGELTRLSLLNRPSVDEVNNITAYKERLICTLDQISLAIEPLHKQLDGIMELCQEVSVHPFYHHMEDLQILTYYYIRKVINKEDINNPDIIRRLKNYKESLELDKAVSEVPQSQRQVYMFVPDKKN
ncbi:MAG: hypothetical protein K2N73_09380 [Lachnospiraceae bacterium]|nr:hypothetical protein [Lachnospiraceae bacterium]